MRKDTSTMTRAELMHNARVFLLTSVLAPFVAFGAFPLVMAMGWPEAIAGFVAFASAVFLLGGLTGGLYFLVRGLLRPRDWTPSQRDIAMTGFSARRELGRLEKMIRAELGPSCAALELAERSVDEPWPTDSRSGWRHFVEGTALTHVQRQLWAQVTTASRELDVFVEVGCTLESRRARWLGVIVCAPCRAQTRGWTWPLDEIGEPSGLASEELQRTLRSIVCASSRFDGLGVNDLIRRDDASFRLEAEGRASRATLVTLPQERRAGLQWLLGLAGFLTALESIERKEALQAG